MADVDRDVIRPIENLKDMDQPDWDSYEAPSIAPEATEQAKAFVRVVESTVGHEYARPLVGPTPEGGVALVWRNRNKPKVEVFLAPSQHAAAKYVVLEKGHLLEHGAIVDIGVFAATVIRKYVSL